jgi:hypothetical protein
MAAVQVVAEATAQAAVVAVQAVVAVAVTAANT